MADLEERFGFILDDCNANGIDGRDYKTLFKGLFYSPAVRILLSYRFQKRLKEEGGAFRLALARLLWMRSVNVWGCDIGNQADIAPGVCISHTVGIVIGNGVVIEQGCKIFHGVTLGDDNRDDGVMARPVIKSGSVIYAHASVFGDVSVGPDAVVGAHVVVCDDVEEGMVVTHSVGKSSVKKKRKRVA